MCRVRRLLEGRSSGEANDNDDATLVERRGEDIVGEVVLICVAVGGDAISGDAVDGEVIGVGRLNTATKGGSVLSS